MKKVLLGHATPICSHVACTRVHATTAEGRRRHADGVAHKTQNMYYGALYRKVLPTPDWISSNIPSIRKPPCLPEQVEHGVCIKCDFLRTPERTVSIIL